MKNNFKDALRSTKAAIDLASIMVGIIVIGIIGGVIAATVFAVIPWAQDNAAKSSLDSVATAQSAQRGFTEKYSNYAGLVASGLIGTSATTTAVTSADGKCFVALSKSSTGKVFYTTNTQVEAKTYVPESTTNSCVASDVVDQAYVDAFGPLPNSFATRTTARVLTGSVQAAAVSGNGSKAIAFSNSTYRLSNNGGATFGTPSAFNSLYTSPTEVAMNGNGSVILVGQNSGNILISRDGGATFAAGGINGTLVNVSADGQRMYTINGLNVTSSMNGGTTWTSKFLGSPGAYDLDVSSDGTKLAAITTTGVVYVSNDSGTTWTARPAISGSNFRSIGINTDGKSLVASSQKGVYTSSDNGLTWKQVRTEPSNSSNFQFRMDVSFDASKIVISNSTTGILTSIDGGKTWVGNPSEITSGISIANVSMSGDGSKVLTSSGLGLYFTKFSN